MKNIYVCKKVCNNQDFDFLKKKFVFVRQSSSDVKVD